MKYAAVLFAGVAAAAYVPNAESSWPATTSSSSVAAGYWPSKSVATSSSSSSPAGYWPSKSVATSSSSSAKPTWTTIECEGPTTFTWGSTTYSATSATSWVLPCEETTTTAAPVKPTYAATWPAVNASTPATTPTWAATTASAVYSSSPLQVTANAAVNNVAGAGAGLAGVFAAVAYLL
ncbi:uncharacterized protein PV09_03522 [Verruconis gallopava]|uniref:Ig-like domain-containing protein n=1 Tax=Verruconis gallopava TaxID=253628 RepID=A0A0D1XSC6_9PEZI|nr:uncharacterized protein PV09_03522 [Verruconis gallopava]KIW05656.1 hypothetical protein PV09_03522 [Verruconis gallopava]